MMLRCYQISALIAMSVGLSACTSNGGITSIKGSECKIFERPEYAVRGKKPYDQDWIDSQIEGGVGGCGWKRPAARPASIDGAADVKPALAPTKRKGIIKRIKDRVTGNSPAIAPVPYVAAPIVPAVAETKVPPKPSRDRVDELLRPSK